MDMFIESLCHNETFNDLLEQLIKNVKEINFLEEEL